MLAYLSAPLFCSTVRLIVRTCKQSLLVMTLSSFHFLPSSLLYCQHCRLQKILFSTKWVLLNVLSNVKASFPSQVLIRFRYSFLLSSHTWWLFFYLKRSVSVTRAFRDVSRSQIDTSLREMFTDIVFLLLFKREKVWKSTRVRVPPHGSSSRLYTRVMMTRARMWRDETTHVRFSHTGGNESSSAITREEKAHDDYLTTNWGRL